MKLVFYSCFLHLVLSSLFGHAGARGGESLSLPSSGSATGGHAGAGRHLFGERPAVSSDVARGYMTNSDLEKAMKAFGRRCGNISRIYSIGKSVNGVPLWVIEISDKPGIEEAEPAFKFIGNVHGDEPVGRELLMLLANYICDNYLKDPLAKLIVENVHLHLLPSMNPDGFALRRRGNANNIDLNRDFPDQGALVANYPWDGTEDKRRYYFASPDDEAFRFMASIYSRSHRNMSLSKEFEGGITNGAAWYPIYGGMQDWNYIHGGCFELTLEVSDNKWPNASELPTLWEYNKMSMLNLVASVIKTGLHGRIYSSDSGRPLPGFVLIKGINSTIKASRGLADYHRMLAPGGKYEVVASMPGYKPKATTIWLEEGAMTLDFILDPVVIPVENQLKSVCDCSCSGQSSIELMGFVWNAHLGVYFLLIVIVLALICILFRRRMPILKHRQTGVLKKPVVV
ncbi:hypothetical protein BT93_F2000 [Corymbia citriodora subsp. variegata]|nr:hypothetical protein BT93_F2000 [Corymbia citriodora subsp. variegata]